MKQFDWEYAAKVHHPVMVEFLKSVQNTDTNEGEFVDQFCQIPRPEGKFKRGMRSPSTARSNYRNLKKNFGFFS